VDEALDHREHLWIADSNHVEELARVALLCLRDLPNEHKLMAEVVLEVVGNRRRIRRQIQHLHLFEQEILPRE
jgi:hypothetical protein